MATITEQWKIMSVRMKGTPMNHTEESTTLRKQL